MIHVTRGHLLTTLKLLACGSSLLGCGTSQDSEEDSSVTNQALASAFGYDANGNDADSRYTNPWVSPGVVNICFVGPDTGPNDNDDPSPTLMAEVEATLATSWQSATGLTFVNQGKCPNPAPSSWLSVFLGEVWDTGVGHGGVGSRLAPDPKWDNRSDIQVYFGDRTGEYRRQAAHELGHALGFYHEMERQEADGSTCDTVGISNLLGHLTGYDRDSIMTWSYCPVVRTEGDLLSSLDRLGAEMMYPKTTSGHKLACAKGCIETPNGVVLRADGSVTIDWVRRGADVDPIWYVGLRTLQPTDGLLLASDVPDGTTVTMTFPDAYGNPNLKMYVPTGQQHALLTGGGVVAKSDAYHTAVIVSSLSM